MTRSASEEAHFGHVTSIVRPTLSDSVKLLEAIRVLGSSRQQDPQRHDAQKPRAVLLLGPLHSSITLCRQPCRVSSSSAGARRVRTPTRTRPTSSPTSPEPPRTVRDSRVANLCVCHKVIYHRKLTLPACRGRRTSLRLSAWAPIWETAAMVSALPLRRGPLLNQSPTPDDLGAEVDPAPKATVNKKKNAAARARAGVTSEAKAATKGKNKAAAGVKSMSQRLDSADEMEQEESLPSRAAPRKERTAHQDGAAAAKDKEIAALKKLVAQVRRSWALARVCCCSTSSCSQLQSERRGKDAAYAELAELRSTDAEAQLEALRELSDMKIASKSLSFRP